MENNPLRPRIRLELTREFEKYIECKIHEDIDFEPFVHYHLNRAISEYCKDKELKGSLKVHYVPIAPKTRPNSFYLIRRKRLDLTEFYYGWHSTLTEEQSLHFAVKKALFRAFVLKTLNEVIKC